MIRMSPRESALSVITLAVVLGVLSWWGGEAKLNRWREAGQTTEGFHTRLRMAQQLVSRRAEMEGRLDTMLKTLPRHPADKDVTAELLKMIESTAADHSLSLTRREPEREKAAGELYEVAIHCNWEGSLRWSIDKVS